MQDRIALIGFGEAGSTFAKAGGWREEASAFDIDSARATAMREAGVVNGADAADALAGAGIVLSLVTAAQALEAARECGPALPEDAIWCDMNSVAPQTKAQAAIEVERHGARYVDIAVLAPVQPAALGVPLLVSGAAADDAAEKLRARGFANVRVVGDEVGRASAIKMVRSIMVKGMEALSDELLAAAAAAGVTDEVLASLDASWREDSWANRTAYNLERMTTHGLRRAEEMEEVAKTLHALGVEPVMTEGTVRRQRDAATRNRAERDAA